jgi:hypothetical protein
MPTTVLYRISSNEVGKISLKGQPFSDRNQTYWGVLTDPPLPDGSAVREELPDGSYGPLRQLGYAKINDSGTVRNATQPEIDTFAGFETDDENKQDAEHADGFIDASNPTYTHPILRKLLVAQSDIIKDEINIVRGWTVSFKAEVAAANNLGDLKAGVATLPDLPDRTLAQLITQIKNRISKDD